MKCFSFGTSLEIGKKLEGMGIKFVDGPVSGGQSGAMNGTLTIMAGGKEEDVKEAMPIFEVVGKNIIHCGECGAGQVVKVANQLMSAINLISMSESVLPRETKTRSKSGDHDKITIREAQAGAGR